MSDIEFLKEAVTRKLVEYLMEDRHIGVSQALDLLQSSRTFSLLMDEKTGLYRESPAHVYEYLKENLRAEENL